MQDNTTDPTSRWSLSTMGHFATEPTLADAALRYANLGIPVFPCAPGGKRPLTPNGFHDATASAKVVHHWWQRTPEANIGLPTGSLTGVLVVDVDIHAGGTGFAAFERARAAGLADGWGWLVRTPSGGLHAYYPATPGDEQRSWQIPTEHLDFRGDGGYVIAPPSRTSIDGHLASYAVIATAHHRARSVDARRLREFLEPPRPTLGPRTPSRQMSGDSDPGTLAEWVAARPEGGRNGGLFWAACRMVESGHNYTETLSTLGAAAEKSGLPEREAIATIRSAFRTTTEVARGPSHDTGAAPPSPLSRPQPGEALGR